MDKAAATEYRLRWQRVTELDRMGLPQTPAGRLRQLTGLLEIARRAGWPLEKPGAEVDEVRDRWRRLRSKLHGRSVR